jgi:AcrR family transcriptional regulator
MTENNRARILDAYLALLARHPLREITMHAVAEEASVSLSTLRKAYSSEHALFDAYAEKVDCAVLDRTANLDVNRPAKDRLFDVLMTRIGVLAEGKAAVKFLLSAAAQDPALAVHFGGVSAREQSWMLVAARIDVRGAAAANLAQALVLVFGRTVQAFLADDSNDLAATRAVLARELDVGAKWMQDLSQAG